MNNHQGFSLLELIIVCSIVVTLLVFILPSQKQFLNKSIYQTSSAQLLHAIHLARNEAMLRGTMVTLCKSKDLKTCSGEWQDGYIIVADEKPIFVFDNKMQGILHWRAFPVGRNDLQFLPSGLPNAENGTYWYCGKGAKNPVWAIVLNKAGRARLIYPQQSEKIMDGKGKRLTCG